MSDTKETATVGSEKFNPILNLEVIETQVNFLQGKVLTVIDAAFADAEQRKAVKDLIRSSFREQLQHINDICYADNGSVVKHLRHQPCPVPPRVNRPRDVQTRPLSRRLQA